MPAIRQKYLLYAGSAVLLVGLIAAFLRPKPKPTPPPPPSKPLSLAVLSFQGTSWAGGLADSIRSRLTANRDPAGDFILTGTTADSAAEVHLTRAGQQPPIWTQHFEGSPAELADSIARATLEKTHIGQFNDRVAKERTSSNAKAYRLYLEGDYRGAVQWDPRYAAAWAKLGAWEKALALDPELPEAHAAHARALWRPAHHFPVEDVIAEYRRAIAADPQLAEARSELSWVLLHIAALDAALAEARAAVAYDPENADLRFQLGVAQLYAGRYQDAVDLFKNVPRTGHPLLWYSHAAWAHLELRQTTRASSYLDEYDRLYGVDTDGLMSSLYALLQARFNNPNQSSRGIAAALEDSVDHGYFHHTAYFVARAYALLGKNADAAFWLQQAKSNGFPQPPAIK